VLYLIISILTLKMNWDLLDDVQIRCRRMEFVENSRRGESGDTLLVQSRNSTDDSKRFDLVDLQDHTSSKKPN
jgi:hypothetical protein